jgi:hypothetical protein
LIVAYLIRGSFTARGQIVSYVLYLVELQLIERFIKKKDVLSCFGITLISCIIANTHATAWPMTLILFLPYIGEYVVANFTLIEMNNRQEKKYKKKLSKLEKRNNSKNSEKILKLQKEIEHCEEFRKDYKVRENAKIIIEKIDNEKFLFIPIICAIIGALITPIGNIPFTYYLKISIGNSLNYISEHFPAVMATSLPFMTFTIIMVALLGFTNSKLKLSDAFLILGLYIMTVSSYRNCYLLIPICAVPIAKMIDDFIKTNTEVQTKEYSKSVQSFFDKLFIIFCIALLGYSGYNYIVGLNETYVDESAYPTKAAQFINENLDVENIKLFNEYETGSYLMMQGIPVFIDSRCDLYTPEFNKDVTILDDYMETLYGKSTVFDLMDKYEMDYAVLTNTSIMYTYMIEDDRCTVLYEDDYFTVFEYQNEF